MTQHLLAVSHVIVSYKETPLTHLRELNLYIYTGSKVELHQSINGLGCRLNDIEQPFIRPHFELLARLFVNVRSAVYGELLFVRRQWNRSTDQRASPACRISDIASCLIQYPMIECLEANANILRFHKPYTDAKEPKINRPDFPRKEAGAAKNWPPESVTRAAKQSYITLLRC